MNLNLVIDGMVRRRRTSFSLALVLSGCVTVSAQDKVFEAVASLEPLGRLALETGQGTVRLSSWDRPTVDIRARIEPPVGADADEGQRSVEGTIVEVRGSRRSVRIRSVYGAVRSRVHYEIRAPREIDLDLVIRGADTTLGGFEGRLFLELYDGVLEADDLTGTIVLDLDSVVLR